MTVTEFAIIQLNKPYAFHSEAVHDHFRTLSVRQPAFSTFPLYFFIDTTDPSILYFLAGWDSVDAHMRWIESDGNQELLKILEPYLNVKGLFHIDIDFNTVPSTAELVVIEKRDEASNNTTERPPPYWSTIGKDVEAGASYIVSMYEKKGDIKGWVSETGQHGDYMIMERVIVPSPEVV